MSDENKPAANADVDKYPGVALLTLAQAAELMQVGRTTLYDAIRRNEIPGVVHIGRHIRLNRAVVLALGAAVGPPSRARRKHER